jgi:hypothetical protein
MKRTICMAVLVLVAGCGPSSRTSSRATSSVAFVGSWSEGDRGLALAALEVHRARFELAHGPLGGVRVEVHAGALLPSGNVGEALPPDAFRVAAGARLELAGATHEMHHLRDDPGLAHADPRWPSWDDEDARAVAAIRAGRP